VQFVIITGISGSGKSLALRIFEDLGYFCVDNIPPALIPQLAELCRSSMDEVPSGTAPCDEERRRSWRDRSDDTSKERGSGYDLSDVNRKRIACVIDVRSGSFLTGLGPALGDLEANDVRPHILFLDADDSTLVNRFKETRRRHPLLGDTGGILGSLAAERERLQELKERADKVIDTSDYTPRSLATALAEYFGAQEAPSGPIISVLSFGFKHGLPLDADLVFDVRFLANPHYVRELRWHDGRNQGVIDHIRQDPLTEPFLCRLCDLVDFTLPEYIREGKAYLTIAIGCTGGRHRSVFVAEELARFLRSKSYHPVVHHRDAKK
jgi:UPF0042 nucleotide-binding protein